MLTEAQVSALEKKQESLSFTTRNTHRFITGPQGWVCKTLVGDVYSAARDINDKGQVEFFRYGISSRSYSPCLALGATGVGRKPLPSRERVGNGRVEGRQFQCRVHATRSDRNAFVPWIGSDLDDTPSERLRRIVGWDNCPSFAGTK